jgi:hypothetical protein
MVPGLSALEQLPELPEIQDPDLRRRVFTHKSLEGRPASGDKDVSIDFTSSRVIGPLTQGPSIG